MNDACNRKLIEDTYPVDHRQPFGLGLRGLFNFCARKPFWPILVGAIAATNYLGGDALDVGKNFAIAYSALTAIVVTAQIFHGKQLTQLIRLHGQHIDRRINGLLSKKNISGKNLYTDSDDTIAALRMESTATRLKYRGIKATMQRRSKLVGGPVRF